MKKIIQSAIYAFALIGTLTIGMYTGNSRFNPNIDHSMNVYDNPVNSFSMDGPIHNLYEHKLEEIAKTQGQFGSVYQNRLNPDNSNNMQLQGKRQKKQKLKKARKIKKKQEDMGEITTSKETSFNSQFLKKVQATDVSDKEIPKEINIQSSNIKNENAADEGNIISQNSKLKDMKLTFVQNQSRQTRDVSKKEREHNESMEANNKNKYSITSFKNDNPLNYKESQLHNKLVELCKNAENNTLRLITAEFDTLMKNFIVNDLSNILDVVRESLGLWLADYKLFNNYNRLVSSYTIISSSNLHKGKTATYLNKLNLYISDLEEQKFKFSQFAIQHEPDFTLKMAQNIYNLIEITNVDKVKKGNNSLYNSTNNFIYIHDAFEAIVKELILFGQNYNIKENFYKQYAKSVIKMIFLKNFSNEFSCLKQITGDVKTIINMINNVKRNILKDIQEIDESVNIKKITILFQHLTMTGMPILEYYNFIGPVQSKIIKNLIQNNKKNTYNETNAQFAINFSFGKDKIVPILLKFTKS